MSVSPVGGHGSHFSAWAAIQEQQQAAQSAETASAQLGASVGGDGAPRPVTPPPIGLNLFA